MTSWFAFAALAAVAAGCCHGAASPSSLPAGGGRPLSTSSVDAGPPRKPTAPSPTERIGTLPPDVGLAVGSRMPDAVVHDADGHEVRLGDFLDGGPILVVFYRGGWCPFCNFQIRELTVAYPEYRRRGATPVAISVDRAEESAKTRATYVIPFPVLSDPDLAAHRAFRVVHHADDAEVARLRGFGMDLERASGRAHHDIAIPSMFLVDRDGVIRWAHADRDYRVRPSTAQVLAAIDALGWTQPPRE